MARQPNPEGTNRKRTAEVRIKLSPAIAEGLGAVAERRGILPATLAAVVIGEYLEKQDENTKIQRMVALDMSKRALDVFSPEMMAHAMTTLTPDQLDHMRGVANSIECSEGAAGKAGSSAAPEAAAPSRGTRDGDRVRSAT